MMAFCVPAKGDVNVLVALGEDFVPLNAALFFRNKRPRLVQLQTVHADADHHAVVQFSAATADAQRQGANRFAVDASDPCSSADS